MEGAIVEVSDFSPWLKELQLGDMVPFNFTARDGVELSGYITLPPDYRRDKKFLSLFILMVVQMPEIHSDLIQKSKFMQHEDMV